jgi:predicted dehydrogenase
MIFEEKIERAKQRIGAGSAESYQDLQTLLDSDVDAVVIATPVFLHADHFEAAVASGKHIYIEKPAAQDVAGCVRIMRLADSADRKVNITFGFQRRYGQVYQKATARLQEGAIGDVRLAHVHFIKDAVRVRDPNRPKPVTETEKIRAWYPWRELSGDLIVENNVHSIDVMNWFVGAHPIKATGAGGKTVETYGDMRDHLTIAFEYPGRVQGSLIGSGLASRGYRDVVEQFWGGDGMIETSENHWKHFRGRDDEEQEASPRNISIDALDAFVKRIAEGKPENTGVRGAESTLTAILGRMAIDAKREVSWEEMMRA